MEIKSLEVLKSAGFEYRATILSLLVSSPQSNFIELGWDFIIPHKSPGRLIDF